MSYNQIPQNPYIVGNPIQSSSMFYGRNEDFLYIKDKLQKEARGLIITLAGERRSGKTSILFQILNGRLGEEYLPFFVDMQAMAAVESDAQFLSRLDNVIRTQLTIPVAEQDYQGNKWSAFENFLNSVKEAYPGKKIIFLLDEYEIIENKIDKQMITAEMITFFANLMENHNIFFLFTGSTKLEDRNASYWKTLFSKSQYRKITFLKKQDCIDLITKPVENFVIYTPDQLENIWRLTAGQPFYTQIFCQNMVDRLQLEQRNEVLEEDIDAVITDIVDNPMPQMIYFWQELDAKHKLTLSLLAEINTTKDKWADCDDLLKCLKNQKIDINIHASDFHTAFEELYHNDILSKKGKQYQFRVDIFRFWIKQEQNVWKLLKEVNLDKEAKPTRNNILAVSIVGLLVVICAGVLFYALKPKPATIQSSKPTQNTKIEEIYVDGGTFTMGDTAGGGIEDEKPTHQVKLSSFYIGKYEVTQEQWQDVMNYNPSVFRGESLPVEAISWYDCIEFCNKLSLQKRLMPCYSGDRNNITCNWTANGYRLLTEAEWEYAAKGGKKSKGYKYSGDNEPQSVAWYAANSSSRTHQVGQKRANELGLSDMSGNVWEWCWDRFKADYYSLSPISNPRGPEEKSYRLLRGGSWFFNEYGCRVSTRNYLNEGDRRDNIGFRLCRRK